MDAYWVPGVNRLASHGRWAFAEFTDVYAMQQDFAEAVEAAFGDMLARAGGSSLETARTTKRIV